MSYWATEDKPFDLFRKLPDGVVLAGILDPPGILVKRAYSRNILALSPGVADSFFPERLLRFTGSRIKKVNIRDKCFPLQLRVGWFSMHALGKLHSRQVAEDALGRSLPSSMMIPVNDR